MPGIQLTYQAFISAGRAENAKIAAQVEGRLKRLGPNATPAQVAAAGLTPDEIAAMDKNDAMIAENSELLETWETDYERKRGQKYERADAADMRYASAPPGWSQRQAGHGGGVNPGAKFRDMFPAVALDRHGFASFNHFAAQLRSGYIGPELLALVNEGNPAEGGALVPTQFAQELFDGSLEDEVIRPAFGAAPGARIEPMTSSEKKISGYSHIDGTAGPFGLGDGTAGWSHAEGAEITPQTPGVRGLVLHAHELALLFEISNEALADGSAIDGQLDRVMQRTMSYRLDHAFIRGTGAGMPLGILNSPALITVAVETGQTAADGVLMENLAKMVARIHPASFSRSVWLVNPTVLPSLLTVAQPFVGTPNVIATAQGPGGGLTIYTRPVIITEKCSALNTVGDILLVDRSMYVVGLRMELELARSAHLGFSRNTSHMRGIVRADGQPLLNSAVTLQAGGTVSPFVALAARS